MKTIFNLNKVTLKRKVSGIGASMYSLRDPQGTLKVLLKEAWRISSLSLGRTKVESRVRVFHNFFWSLVKISKNHGVSYTIKYMKASSVAIQRTIAKSPYRSLRELEPTLPFPRLYSGLPSLIGSSDRRLIRQGHNGIIRFWLTLFGLYRVLEAPTKAKLNTITDPFTGKVAALTNFDRFSQAKFWFLLREFKFSKEDVKTSAEFIVRSRSAGPNSPVAMSAFFSDLCWIAQDEQSYNLFKNYAIASKSRELFRLLDNSIEVLFNALNKGARIPIKGRFLVDSSIDKLRTVKLFGRKVTFVSPSAITGGFLYGGQLAFKEEAAGKLRIFAILDIWTQSFLEPLHRSIFKLLKSLPNDGTFDQNASFTRAMEKSVKYGHAWSVDLTSATDRLPIILQESLLSSLTGSRDLAKAWKDLLIGRDYLISGDPSKLESYGLEPGSVQYSVGQPMGALSSWAMLALTHHFIVQFAVQEVRGNQSTWYDGYEVLGDDIVLFEEDVYLSYTRILNDLGVPVNLSKSIPSPKVASCEFAKRTSLEGKDVSGLSWKELLQGNNLPGKVNLALRLGPRALLTNISLLKAVLCRFSSDMTQPLQVGAHHGLLSILGALLNYNKAALNPAICALVDPHDETGEGIDPKKVSIPVFQVMRLIVALFNGKPLSECDELLSDFDTRSEIAQDEIIPFMAQTAYRTAYAITKDIVNEYDSKVAGFARTLIDISRCEDRILEAQIRGISEEILLQGKDPQDRLDALEDKVYKAAKYGMSLKDAISLLDDATAYSMSFDFREVERATIPTDNKLALLASNAGGNVRKYWYQQTEFAGYERL